MLRQRNWINESGASLKWRMRAPYPGVFRYEVDWPRGKFKGSRVTLSHHPSYGWRVQVSAGEETLIGMNKQISLDDVDKAKEWARDVAQKEFTRKRPKKKAKYPYMSEAVESYTYLVVRPGHSEFDKIYGKGEKDYYVISVHRNENDAEKRLLKVRRNGVSSSTRSARVVKVGKHMKLKRGEWVRREELDRMAEDANLWDKYGEKYGRVLTSLGFNPSVDYTPEAIECPRCGEKAAYIREAHADTGNDTMELRCRSCKHVEEI